MFCLKCHVCVSLSLFILPGHFNILKYKWRNPWRQEKEGCVEKEKTAHVISSSLDLLVQFVLVLVPERRVTHQQDVENHPWHTHRNRKHTSALVCFLHISEVRTLQGPTTAMYVWVMHTLNRAGKGKSMESVCVLHMCMWCTTHHRPRCPQVYHMPPSLVPRGTDIPVYQQILQINTQTHTVAHTDWQTSGDRLCLCLYRKYDNMRQIRQLRHFNDSYQVWRSVLIVMNVCSRLTEDQCRADIRLTHLRHSLSVIYSTSPPCIHFLGGRITWWEGRKQCFVFKGKCKTLE